MQYMGSKNRLSKYLAPIIQSYITEETVAYIEPFVGGANMIDKINHHTRIGSDIHSELIELLKYARDSYYFIPDTITEEEYIKVKLDRDSYDEWYVGLVGFCGSFGSRYFEGFARAYMDDKVTRRDVPAEAIRSLKKQAPKLKGIQFKKASFTDYNPSDYKNCVFYLDPPYKGTKGYTKCKFNEYDTFYKWCIDLAKNNTVLISEYDMPDDMFKPIWSKDVKVNISNQGDIKNKKRVEKLFMIKKGE